MKWRLRCHNDDLAPLWEKAKVLKNEGQGIQPFQYSLPFSIWQFDSQTMLSEKILLFLALNDIQDIHGSLFRL